MKKPDECACACCRAAFCWAAKCCCSALSLKSFRLSLAPGVFMDGFCISRLRSFSSSARIATRVLFGKACPGGLAAISACVCSERLVYQPVGLDENLFSGSCPPAPANVALPGC